ncbi:MAG: hypothetical protein NVS4B12_17000 [Ktedonobacteraceae bacterium]
MQEVRSILPDGSIVRDRYVVEALLGKGGFGAVYRVRDMRVKGNQFALKEVIDPKKHDRVHALFEGEVLKKLDHSALPRVYRVFEDEPRHRVYMLMDYIEGPNLERLRHQQPEKRFSFPNTMRLVAPIVEAVIYLQNWQPPIIHRDIKPANIIVPPNGDEPVLVDFGIAKEYDQDATTTAVRRLSPNYSAPEQYTQGTNPRTDIYGMAATLYTLLAGTPPVDAFERITQIGKQRTDPLEPLNRLVPDLPVSVAEAIHRAMALSPDQRFPTMEAFWHALQPQSFLAPSPTPITPLPGTHAQATTLLAANTISTVSTVRVSRQDQGRRSKRRGLLLPLFAFIALTAVLVGALLGTGILPIRNPFHSSAFSGTATTSQHGSSLPPPKMTATHSVSATQGAISTPIPTPTATVSVTVKPTPVPPTYPSLDSQYTGSIHNTPANIDGTMTLTGVHQNGANINGLLTLTNGLQGQAAFTGTVSSNNTLRFLVTPYTQYLPLLFDGRVNGDGSLTGTYCSARGNQCDYASGGYGTWRVSPPAPSSNIPSHDNGNLVLVQDRYIKNIIIDFFITPLLCF